jgi:hypothetical protein
MSLGEKITNVEVTDGELEVGLLDVRTVTVPLAARGIAIKSRSRTKWPFAIP